MTPTTLGHYRIEGRIGQGGMGEVYRARDTRLERVVAIKLWRRDEHVGQIRPLIREARAASALNHPNIVVIHEVGEAPDGSQYIVQEFVEGRTLRELAAEPIPTDRLIEIGVQIARALSAAHAAGIVHRDIKPDNVMVRADGYVKVLDFGLARVEVEPGVTTESTKQVTFATQPGTIIGTPSYMAPEQVQGQAVGPPTDVFALGILLYELATGRRPFTAPSAIGVMASITSESPVPVTRLAPERPRALDDLIQSMLEKAPDRRPTAEEIERRLAQCAAELTRPARIAVQAPTTVGREVELERLHAAFTRAREGSSVMIGVAGEPGIGKTTLLDDLLVELAESHARPILLRGRCSETLAGAEAYVPVIDALESLVSPSSGPSYDALVRTVAPTWHAQLAAPVSPTSERGSAEPAPASSQERLKRELAALFKDLSRRATVVWVIDDLHWADISTIDMLSHLSAHFGNMRLLVLTGFRPSDMALAKHPFLAIRGDLQSRRLYEEICLTFLTRDDVARYLAVQFPGHRLPDAFVDSIHARTEGSPLFMVDLVRYLRDTGAISKGDQGWELGRSMAETPRDLPESVRGMITRKIERVDEVNRKLLLAASVQGQEFDSALVAAALGMDEGEVEERLETLERVHVFVRRGDEHEYPDRTLSLKYRFVHVLYQNVLHGSLQPSRRASLSARTAQALAAHQGADTAAVAGHLALLYEMARDFAASARFFYQAAQRAVSLFAFREALPLAERGLDGLRGLPDGPEQRQLELGLQMIKGLSLRSVKGWAAPELEPTFTRARQICQELKDPPELFHVLWNLAFLNMIRGNIPVVQEQLVTLMPQAEAAAEPAFLMAASHVAGVTCEFAGDVVESSRLLEQARTLHDPARHEVYNAMFGTDPGMHARAMSSRSLWALGYPDRALERIRETIALGREQRQRVTLVFALIVGEGVHLARGEAAQAVALGDEAVALCREWQFPHEIEWARAFRGAALARHGRVEEGIQEQRDSLAALRALRSGLVRTMFLSLLADSLWRAGLVDEGFTIVDEGFAHAEQTSERGFLHELNRLRGELLLLAGRETDAESHLRTALDLASRRSARGFELRAATSLARWLGSSGRAAEGRAILQPVHDWFTEGLETADLVTARHVLSDLR